MKRLLLGCLLLASCGGDGGGGGGGTAALGASPFMDGELATWELAMAPADWDSIVNDPMNNQWRRATVTWRGVTLVDVGVRPSGEESRIPGNRKPSLRLSFDEFAPGRTLGGVTGLKLDSLGEDPSMIRERIAYRVYRERGLAAPQYAHARVVVNGEYKGLYGVEERINRGFIAARFGAPAGQIYRFTNFHDDMKWAGSDPALYVPDMFAARNERVPADAALVRDLVSALSRTPADAATLFDVEGFINYMACETVTGDMDGYLGGPFPPDSTAVWTGDIFLYRVPATGKFAFLKWDCGQAYQRDRNTSITNGFELRELTNNLILNQSENRSRYRQMLLEIVNGPHQTAKIQAELRRIVDQIRQAALDDPNKPYSNTLFLEAVDWLQRYVELRNDSIRQQAS